MDSFGPRRKRYEAVLRPLGLWEGFAAMPRTLQVMFWKMKLPDPAVVFDDDAAAAAPTGLRAAAERYLRNATVTIDGVTGLAAGDGLKIPVRDFIGVVTGIMHFGQAVNLGWIPAAATMPPELKAFLAAATPVLERCHLAHLQAAWNAMYGAVMLALVQASRMDARLFTARLDAEPNERGRRETRVTVTTSPAQVRHVELDGTARPMYRAGRIGRGTGDVQWVSWDGSLIRGGQAGREHPVYVQAHALRKLRERLRLPGMGPWLDVWLAESLAEPNVVERQGGDLLVEFRVKQYRLGYLVVMPAAEEGGQGSVAVRTFKFLTMENTPEARRLERRLKLSRPDVNWLRLHELESFTHTDLRGDPLLRRLMEECGCGHLFKLAEEYDFAPQPKALAAEVRKYLRLAA